MTEAMTIETDEPRLNRRQQAKLDTAAKVLTSARLEFETKGYGSVSADKGATIRDIAKGAKMSTGAVFANYTDKEALYVAVYGHKPITPELGRAAMIALCGLMLDLGEAEAADELSAIDVLRNHASYIFDMTGFPQQAITMDEEETSADRMRRALQTWAKGPTAGPAPDVGAGFRKYVQGADGQPIEVTTMLD